MAPFESNDRTISTPGTARKVITAANYAVGGGLASTSSRGPTRDNRSAPTLAAPGSDIYSAAALFGNGNGDPYRSDSGTSMSAPHIAGVIALMFQKNRNRTQEQIRACLTSTARNDGFTGPVPNTGWGAGKVDAKAAVDCVPFGIVQPGPVSVVTMRCPSVVQVRCPTRVPALCMQPPRTDPFPCPQTTPLTCQILTNPINCLQQTTPVTCLQQSVRVFCGGPSVVDGCPSTPGGCHPGTFVTNPGRLGLQPSNFLPEVEQAALAAAETAYWATLQAMMGPMMDPGSAEAGSYNAAELTEGGYFEYDESWFEPNGSDGSGSES